MSAHIRIHCCMLFQKTALQWPSDIGDFQLLEQFTLPPSYALHELEQEPGYLNTYVWSKDKHFLIIKGNKETCPTLYAIQNSILSVPNKYQGFH